jgi:hypothetical protein
MVGSSLIAAILLLLLLNYHGFELCFDHSSKTWQAGRLPMLEENNKISLPLICLLSFSPGSVLLLICFHAGWRVDVSMA